jgi:hypothetical protein
LLTAEGVQFAFQYRYLINKRERRNAVYVLTIRGLAPGLHEARPDMFDDVTGVVRRVCFPHSTLLVAQPNAFEFIVCQSSYFAYDDDDVQPAEFANVSTGLFFVLPQVLQSASSCDSLAWTALPPQMRVLAALHNIAVVYDATARTFSVVQFGSGAAAAVPAPAPRAGAGGPAVHGGLRRRVRARSRSRSRGRTRKSSRRSRAKQSSRRSRSRSRTRKPSRR